MKKNFSILCVVLALLCATQKAQAFDATVQLDHGLVAKCHMQPHYNDQIVGCLVSVNGKQIAYTWQDMRGKFLKTCPAKDDGTVPECPYP